MGAIRGVSTDVSAGGPTRVYVVHMVKVSELGVGDDEDGDGSWTLVEAQRAMILRALATPEFTASLERLQAQAAQTAQRTIARGMAQQASAILRAARVQQAIAAASLRPALAQQLRTQRSFEPLLAQIAERQRELARVLASAATAQAVDAARAGLLTMTPDLTAALRRISAVAPVALELPGDRELDHLAGLLESGEIEPSTVEAAEAGLASDEELWSEIDRAADALSAARPWLSRARARQLVVLWVYFMIMAGLTVIAVAAPPVVGALVGAAGVGSVEAAKGAGKAFDKWRPPEDDQDSEH